MGFFQGIKRFFFPTVEDKFEKFMTRECPKWILEAGWQDEGWSYELQPVKQLGVPTNQVFAPCAIFVGFNSNQTKFIALPIADVDGNLEPMPVEIAVFANRQSANAGFCFDGKWQTTNAELTEFLMDGKRNNGPCKMIRANNYKTVELGKYKIKSELRMVVSPLKTGETLLLIRTLMAGYAAGVEFIAYQNVLDDVLDVFGRYKKSNNTIEQSKLPGIDFYLQLYPQFTQKCAHLFTFGEPRLICNHRTPAFSRSPFDRDYRGPFFCPATPNPPL